MKLKRNVWKKFKRGEIAVCFLGDRELEKMSLKDKKEIARCYREVFNSSAFSDRWTEESALQQVEISFATEKTNRLPICTLLQEGVFVRGFAWGNIVTLTDLEPSIDMPFYLPEESKNEGLKAVEDVFRVREKFFLFREFGAQAGYRGGVSAFMVKELFEASLRIGADRLLYWTSRNSPAFWLGVSLKWEPFYNFPGTEYWLLKGKIPYSLKLIKGGVEGNGLIKIISFGIATRNKTRFRKQIKDIGG